MTTAGVLSVEGIKTIMNCNTKEAIATMRLYRNLLRKPTLERVQDDYNAGFFEVAADKNGKTIIWYYDDKQRERAVYVDNCEIMDKRTRENNL